MEALRIETSNGRCVEIDIDPNFKSIGLRISGGADSALTGYMLCDYIEKNSLEDSVQIVPITINQTGKAYQKDRAESVLRFYNSIFPNIKFGIHHSAVSENETLDYSKTQTNLSKSLIDAGIIDCYFVGITANPPISELNSLGIISGKYPLDREYEIMRPNYIERVYTPLTNSHKKDVALLYKYYGVEHSLYRLTRSCESYNMQLTRNMTVHCGSCYHCIERFWGFGRYE